MSKLDLEKMQGAWRQQSQRVEASLSLDIAGVRKRLTLGTQSAFKRHLRWLSAEIILGGATLIALLVFIASHRSDSVYLAAALPLLAMVLFAFGTDVRHWQILSRLNLSAPIVQVRAVVDAVRTRRLLVVKWVVLSACLLWLPLIAVLLKAAFSLDLLRGLHISVVVVNVALGVLLIPIGLMFFGWFAKRFAQAPAFQRFVENASGTSFSAARSSFELEADFESGLSVRDSAAAVAQLQQSQWPMNADAPLRQLRKVNLFGILFWAFLIWGNGSFNFGQGGNDHALVAAILLHLFLIIQMIAGIVQRALLANLGATSALPLAAQIQSLRQLAQWRDTVARLSIVIAPLLALTVMQVSARLIYSIDLYASVGPGVAISALTASLVLSMVLYFRWRRAGTSFAQHASNALTFGALNLTRRLLGTLAQ